MKDGWGRDREGFPWGGFSLENYGACADLVPVCQVHFAHAQGCRVYIQVCRMCVVMLEKKREVRGGEEMLNHIF